MLRRYVKEEALNQNRHPNSVWAELKRKYNFYSYKQLSCEMMKEIMGDLNINSKNNKKEIKENNKKDTSN